MDDSEAVRQGRLGQAVARLAGLQKRGGGHADIDRDGRFGRRNWRKTG
jgi:hypothetical protein